MAIINHKGESVTLDLSRCYPASPNQRAIEATCADGEPWATFTVCLPKANLEADQTILDTNDYPEIVDILGLAGLIVETGVFIPSGFCRYPVVTFTDKAKDLYSS